MGSVRHHRLRWSLIAEAVSTDSTTGDTLIIRQDISYRVFNGIHSKVFDLICVEMNG